MLRFRIDGSFLHNFSLCPHIVSFPSALRDAIAVGERGSLCSIGSIFADENAYRAVSRAAAICSRIHEGQIGRV